jgi:hypothetical protein
LDFLTGGNGVLGGQPQQAQPRLPIQPLDEGGNAMAAVQNFAASPTLLGALANAYTGATSGMRTDPYGSQMQMLNFTYQALRQAGVPDAQAQLGATNPDVQRAIVARMFPTYEFKTVGDTAGSFSPTSGQFQPQFQSPQFKTAEPGAQVFSYQPPLPGQPVPRSLGVGGPSPQYPRTQPGPMQASPLGNVPRAPIQSSPLAPPAGASGPMSLPGGTTVLSPGMTPRQMAAERTAGEAQGAASAGLDSTKTTLDYMRNTIKEIREHPGLRYAVGPAVGAAPWLPGQGGDFIAALGGLQGQAFVQALNNLKGRRGVEPEKLQASIADLSRKQSPEQFTKQLDALDQLVSVQRENAIKAAGENPADHAASTLPQGRQSAAPTYSREQLIAEAKRRGLKGF